MQGVVGQEGKGEDAYAGEGLAGHLVEEKELCEGVWWLVYMLGVAYIEDGGLRAFDAPGEERERGGKGLWGDGGEVGDTELDGCEDGRGLGHQGEDLCPISDEGEVAN